MSLLLLFGGSTTATGPIPIYQLATTGGQPALRTSGAQPAISTTGGQTTLATKGPA